VREGLEGEPTHPPRRCANPHRRCANPPPDVLPLTSGSGKTSPGVDAARRRVRVGGGVKRRERRVGGGSGQRRVQRCVRVGRLGRGRRLRHVQRVVRVGRVGRGRRLRHVQRVVRQAHAGLRHQLSGFPATDLPLRPVLIRKRTWVGL
jgi:hypothetical protein